MRLTLKANSQPPEHTTVISLKGQTLDVIDHQLSIDIPNWDGYFADPPDTTKIRMNIICKAAHAYFETFYGNNFPWADIGHFVAAMDKSLKVDSNSCIQKFFISSLGT